MKCHSILAVIYKNNPFAWHFYWSSYFDSQIRLNKSVEDRSWWKHQNNNEKGPYYDLMSPKCKRKIIHIYMN